MKVAPSILSADFGRLSDEIRAICEAGADLVHVDVMDGHFVPNLTIGPIVVNSVKKSSTIPLDIHLMVKNVPFFVDMFLPIKPKYLTFHIEEEVHPLRLIEHIRNNEVCPAVVLNPHTPISTLEYIIKEVDMILLMSVNPGFGGQKFIESTYEKITQLKELILKKNSSCLIEVDGGVNDKNITSLKKAGADIVVAGNYVFSSNDYKVAIDSLKI